MNVPNDKTLEILEKASPIYLDGGKNQVAVDWRDRNRTFDFYKFSYILKGTPTFEAMGQTLTACPGDLVVIPPDIKHSYYNDKDIPVVLYWCHIQLPTDVSHLFDHRASSLCIKSDASIREIFEMVIGPIGRNPVLKLFYRKSAMLKLFYAYLCQLEEEDLKIQTEDAFYTIISNHIAKNYQRALTVDALSDLVYLHPNYFFQVFQSHFHMTPTKYINRIRLEQATRMLKNKPTLTIQQIADQCGFSDYRYFSRVFKKRYEQTPSQFRNSDL